MFVAKCSFPFTAFPVLVVARTLLESSSDILEGWARICCVHVFLVTILVKSMGSRSYYDERSSQIFETLNWKTIREILDERQLVMTFKAIQGLGPDYLTQLFDLNYNTSPRLRSNNRCPYLPKPRTDFLENSFSYQGAVSWNILPKNVIWVVIKGSMSLTLFKSCITKANVSN